MDLSKLMDMAGQMQKQLATAQEEVAAARFEGEAGAGMVRVTLNGRYEVLGVRIEPVCAKGDVKLLEDLVRAACNQAGGKVSEALKARLGGMAQGLGVDLPDLDFLKQLK